VLRVGGDCYDGWFVVRGTPGTRCCWVSELIYMCNFNIRIKLIRICCLLSPFGVGFSLLREVSLRWRWKCYGSVVIVTMVGSSLEVHQVRVVVGWVSWSVCAISTYRSSWSVRFIRINLIHMLKLHICMNLIRINHTDQVDVYGLYESSWSVWFANFEFCKKNLKFNFLKLLICLFVNL